MLMNDFSMQANLSNQNDSRARLLPKAPVVVVTCLAALLLGACPQGADTLEGSVSDSFDLSFDRTELQRINGVTLELKYLRDIEGASRPDIVCKIVVDTPSGGVVAGEAIDIQANNGIIERIAVGGEDFPDLELANITFETGGNEPGAAAGRFTATFENGKTLNGDFETELADVEF